MYAPILIANAPRTLSYFFFSWGHVNQVILGVENVIFCKWISSIVCWPFPFLPRSWFRGCQILSFDLQHWETPLLSLKVNLNGAVLLATYAFWEFKYPSSFPPWSFAGCFVSARWITKILVSAWILYKLALWSLNRWKNA
jgi:hypothetical protein